MKTDKTKLRILAALLLVLVALSSCAHTGTATKTDAPSSEGVSPTPGQTTPVEPATPSETTPSDDEPDEPAWVPEDIVEEFDISDEGGSAKLYICRGENGLYNAVIAGSGKTRRIDPGNHPWAKYSGSIATVRVRGSVETLSERLFHFEDKLETVIIEPGVLSIGLDCFAYCSALKDLYIPETVTEIGQGIVYSSSLENVYLGFDFFEDFREIAIRSNYNFSNNGSLPLDKAHYEYSFHYGDVPDGLDRSGRVLIGSQNSGYQTIFRIKTTQDLLFSPDIDSMRALMGTPQFTGNVEDYTALMHIKVKDPCGRLIYAYPALRLPLHESKGDWFDVFFQGSVNDEEIDSGFCPQPNRVYDVFLEVIDPTGSKVLFAGYYNDIVTPSNFDTSRYFKVYKIPGEELIFYTVRYEASVGGRIEGKTKYKLSYGEEVPSVTAVAEDGYAFLQWSDGKIDPVRTGDLAHRDQTITAEFVTESALKAVPDLFVVTDSGLPVTSKNYEGATVSVATADGSYKLSNAAAQIRGRGNSSWSGGAAQDRYDSKNSYKLKLEEKEPLLGMSSAKKWVLNSNKFDAPGLRTWSMWKMAELMGTIPFYCESRFVNLYVNGVYRGMYTLCEQIEIRKGRVDIGDETVVDDPGFLIEIDFRGAGSGAVNGVDYFYVDGYAHKGSNGPAFVLKSDENTAEKTAAIKEFVQKCSDAIRSGNRARIERLVDIPSLVDMYIIEEFSLDVDVGAASFFIQRSPGGKLCFTAPWDFDFGFGTYGPATSTYGFYSKNENGGVWYDYLIRLEWFRKEVYDRMKELDKEVLPALYKAISDKGEELLVAGDRNARFWNMYGNDFHAYVSSHGTANVYTYRGYIDFLLSWMEERWNWMEENILEETGW
ncbi:MAG: CotH kinase family protein [Clostridia bacterium]|nr:CotH kinase family protein [Clostridia bacterium]